MKVKLRKRCGCEREMEIEIGQLSPPPTIGLHFDDKDRPNINSVQDLLDCPKRVFIRTTELDAEVHLYREMEA